MRLDGNCVPYGDAWYYILREGYSTSIAFMVEVSTSVGNDAANATGQANRRIAYILEAGAHDLKDGAETVTAACLSKGSHVPNIKSFQLALLIIAVIG